MIGDYKMKKILLFIRVLVAAILLYQIINGSISNTFICLLTLALFIVSDLIQRKIKYSNTIQILIYLFIFGTEILGEIYSLYAKTNYFDLIMHALSGYIVASLAIYIIKLFEDKVNKRLIIVFTISLSMAVASLWEIAEFSIDNLLDKDMQKDTIVTEITSTLFSPDKKTPITKKINSIRVNDIDYLKEFGGYIDIGLYDTMGDMIMCLVGTLFYLGINKIAKQS